MGNKHDPVNLFLETYNCDVWFENEESTDATSRKSNKEVKEGKGLKILSQSKLLTRLPILLVWIKAGCNSHKLKNKFRQKLYLLYQHNKITKKGSNNLIK